MAWSTIASFASGNTDIVAKLNQFRDNLNSLRLFNDHGVLLSLADDMDVPNNTVQKISWDVVEHQTGTIWSAGNPTRLTAPVTGIYLAILNIEWRTSTGGERTCGVTYSNGALRMDLESQGSNDGGGNLSAFEPFKLTAGEYLEAHVFQTTGSTIGIRGNGRDRSNVAMFLLGIG